MDGVETDDAQQNALLPSSSCRKKRRQSSSLLDLITQRLPLRDGTDGDVNANALVQERDNGNGAKRLKSTLSTKNAVAKQTVRLKSKLKKRKYRRNRRLPQTAVLAAAAAEEATCRTEPMCQVQARFRRFKQRLLSEYDVLKKYKRKSAWQYYKRCASRGMERSAMIPFGETLLSNCTPNTVDRFAVATSV